MRSSFKFEHNKETHNILDKFEFLPVFLMRLTFSLQRKMNVNPVLVRMLVPVWRTQEVVTDVNVCLGLPGSSVKTVHEPGRGLICL